MLNIEFVASLIASLCSFSSPNFTKESKLECGLYLTNCIVTRQSKLVDEKTLQKCTEDAKIQLQPVN
jgi:hypothetical protein